MRFAFRSRFLPRDGVYRLYASAYSGELYVKYKTSVTWKTSISWYSILERDCRENSLESSVQSWGLSFRNNLTVKNPKWTELFVDYSSSCSQDMWVPNSGFKSATTGGSLTGFSPIKPFEIEPSHLAITSRLMACLSAWSAGKISCSSPCRDGEMVSAIKRNRSASTSMNFVWKVVQRDAALERMWKMDFMKS